MYKSTPSRVTHNHYATPQFSGQPTYPAFFQRSPYHSPLLYTRQNEFTSLIDTIEALPQELQLPILHPLLLPVIDHFRECLPWKEVKMLTESRDPVNSVAYSPDGQFIAAGLKSGSVTIWNVHTGQLIHTLIGHASSVRSVAYSPHGKLLASAGGSTINIWNTYTGDLIHSITASRVRSISYDPDGLFLASAGGYTINIWNTITAGLVRTLPVTVPVSSVAYSPDGKFIAAGLIRGTIEIRNATTNDAIRSSHGHFGDVLSIAYSPDGQFLASGSRDNTILLWNAHTGDLIRSIKGGLFDSHTGRVSSVAYSPDGRFLASGSSDHTAKVWDATTGNLIHTLGGGFYDKNNGSVLSVAYSPDGRFLASGLQYGINIWSTPLLLDELLKNEFGLSADHAFLLYVLFRNFISGKSTNEKDVEARLKAQYGNGTTPQILKLVDNYATLPSDLKEIVQKCFNPNSWWPSWLPSRGK